MISLDIFCEHEYLHIPIVPGGKKNELQIWDGNELVLSPCLALTDTGGETFFLDVRAHQGRTLTLLLPSPDGVTARCLERIVSAGPAVPGSALYPELYRERLRPAFHFSSKRGWLNDPNGLYYADGIYHLYYQHNPLGSQHGAVNICWGHAISSDLLHWEEKDDAIRPWRRDWSIASGSAILDEENRSGYGKNAVIAAFTVLGTPNVDPSRPGYPSGGQFLAASTDGGFTFHRFSHEASIPDQDGKGWRDPRLFRCGDHYAAAVYETDEKGENCVSFYVTDDFHTWRRSSRSGNLYECPDIFPLPVEGGEETHWVLYGADGTARIGEFDGFHFVESGASNPLDYGNVSYAGQTWNHHPEGKRVHISWVRGLGGTGEDFGYEGMPFSQCMTIPAEITLRRFADGLRVCRRPVEQLSSLLREVLYEGERELAGELALPFRRPAQYEVELRGMRGETSIRMGEHRIRYESESGLLSFDNGKTALLPPGDLSFTLLTDTTTDEFCFGGCAMATYGMPPEFMSLILSGNGRVSCVCRRVENIWLPDQTEA